MAPADGRAQERRRRRRLSRDSLQSALVTRLAYVVTGDAQMDATSKAGLTGLTQVLGSRTALQPGEPIGIDCPATSSPSTATVLADRARTGRLPNEAAIRPRRLHEGRRRP